VTGIERHHRTWTALVADDGWYAEHLEAARITFVASASH